MLVDVQAMTWKPSMLVEKYGIYLAVIIIQLDLVAGYSCILYLCNIWDFLYLEGKIWNHLQISISGRCTENDLFLLIKNGKYSPPCVFFSGTDRMRQQFGAVTSGIQISLVLSQSHLKTTTEKHNENYYTKPLYV